MSPAAVYLSVRLAKGDRDYSVPASWVKAISYSTALPPHYIRPDLFEPEWEYPALVKKESETVDEGGSE